MKQPLSRAEKRAQKLADAKINRIFHDNCSGIQIPTLELPNIFKAGHAAIAAGKTDAEITAAIVDYVHSVAAVPV